MPGAGKASVRNAEVQRAWVSRPSQNAFSKGSSKKSVTMPGSREYQYSETTPPVIGASNQWIKAVFDPAHARSYGCIGAPDNNKLPTVVATGKDTITISDQTFPVASTGYAVYYMKQDGGVYTTQQSTTVETRDGTKNERISVYTHPYFGNVVVSKMNTTVTISGGSYLYWIMFVQPTTIANNGRCLSMAHVMENVGDWGNMGGYFTGAHLPVSEYGDANESDYDFLIDASKQESYTTYTAGSAAGIYNIARIRNLDQALFFNPVRDAGTLYLTTQESTETTSAITGAQNFYKVDFGAWDIAASTYFATSTTFTLRITFYSNFENVLDYSQGGSDGARYDRAALEFVMAMFDQHDFIFPADHNDGKKLAKTVKKILIRYRAPILAAMGVSNAPLWLKAATKGIYAGLDAMN